MSLLLDFASDCAIGLRLHLQGKLLFTKKCLIAVVIYFVGFICQHRFDGNGKFGCLCESCTSISVYIITLLNYRMLRTCIKYMSAGTSFA